MSAKRVGPAGKVYGLDMTEEMLALAIRNRDEAGATNVEFLRGCMEDIPLPANTVDVVISNCVINLSTDKPRVFSEMFRVLRPGGRMDRDQRHRRRRRPGASAAGRAWNDGRVRRRGYVLRGVRRRAAGSRVRGCRHHRDTRVPPGHLLGHRPGDEAHLTGHGPSVPTSRRPLLHVVDELREPRGDAGEVVLGHLRRDRALVGAGLRRVPDRRGVLAFLAIRALYPSASTVSAE